jgi:hypothetical protein
MRYWSLFAAKLLGAGFVGALVWLGLATYSPHAPEVSALRALTFLSWKLSWTFTIGAFFVFFCGLIFLCWRDQVYRCRVCCRKLRMPVTHGSWAHALIDRPNTEYICLYGHGKLSVPESQLTGFEASRWTFYGDIWQELFRKTPVAGTR